MGRGLEGDVCKGAESTTQYEQHAQNRLEAGVLGRNSTCIIDENVVHRRNSTFVVEYKLAHTKAV